MKKLRVDFKAKNNTIGWYDLQEDWDLIESSLAKQYGIRIRTVGDMQWTEFCTLIAGLMHDTPLGQVVSIRSETDSSVIKNFTQGQRKIHNEWKQKAANFRLKDAKKLDEDMKVLEKTLERMFG